MPKSTTFDVICLGGGSAALAVAAGVTVAGRSVAVVERERLGGKAVFGASLPASVLLRAGAHHVRAASLSPRLPGDPGEARHDAHRRAVGERDEVTGHGDDAATAAHWESRGVTVVRGTGVITGPGTVRVAGEDVTGTDIVVCTGSAPRVPDIAGLGTVPVWDVAAALAGDELPKSMIVVGGGPSGCEIAQIYASFGVAVDIVEVAPRLLPGEEPETSRFAAGSLGELGVRVHTSMRVVVAQRVGGRVRVRLDGVHDSVLIEAERLVLATGSRPRVDGLGLDAVGVHVAAAGLEVDALCRIAGRDHLLAAGDVTATATHTHTAIYQAGVVVSTILGMGRTADYRAIPRGVALNPPIAAVGMTVAEAARAGIDVVSARESLTSTSRARVDPETRGFVQLVADRGRRVLIGATCVGQGADAMVGIAALAIRAGVDLAMLADVVHPHPSAVEAFSPALARLVHSCDVSLMGRHALEVPAARA